MSIHLDRHQVWQDSRQTIQNKPETIPSPQSKTTKPASQNNFYLKTNLTHPSHQASKMANNKQDNRFGTFTPPKGVRLRSPRDMARLLPTLMNTCIQHKGDSWGICQNDQLMITYEVEFNPTDGRMQNIKLHSNELTDKQLNQIAKYMMIRGRILGLQFEEGVNASATLTGKMIRT